MDTELALAIDNPISVEPMCDCSDLFNKCVFRSTQKIIIIIIKADDEVSISVMSYDALEDHLVEVGPVGADGQFDLEPRASRRTRYVPNGHPHWTVVLLDVHVQVTRVAVVSASDVIVEGDAVGVVLPQLRRQQQSLLSRKSSRCVHHHEGGICNGDNRSLRTGHVQLKASAVEDI